MALRGRAGDLTAGDLTVVLGEAHAEVGFLDFLHEHILLVEEEYDGGGGEVAVVADAVEQVQTFVHPVLSEIRRGFFGGGGWGCVSINQPKKAKVV